MPRAVHHTRFDSFFTRPKRALWVLALPMMTGFAAHSLYLVADMAFIGRLGPAALAGAQFVGSLFFVVMALNIGFTTGVTAVIAQAVGKRDAAGAARLAASAMGFGLLIGIIQAVFFFVSGPFIIPLLGATGDSVFLGIQYFEILCAGMAVMFVSGAIRAVLNGEGDAKTPMTVVLVSTVINAALDPILMFVFELGIRGAALATVASQLFTLIAFCYVAFIKRKSYVAFEWTIERLRPRRGLIAPILKIGLPAAVGQLIMSFGAIFYNRVIAAFGQTAVAGYGAASKVDLLVMLPIVALAGATLSLTGMFAGAKRWDLLRDTVLYAYRVVVSVTVLLSIAAFFFSFKIVGIFTKDPHALETGHIYLRYMVLAYPFAAVSILSGRILQGLGRGIPPLIITTTRVFLIGVPTAFIAVYIFKAPIEVIWSAMVVGGMVAATGAIFWVRYFVWKHPSPKGSTSIPPNLAV